MPKTILVHSFRQGVGRSTITANLAFLLAQNGYRIAIIDTNTKLPATHLFFGLTEKEMEYSFNDYLLGSCNIEQAAYNLNPRLETSPKGQLFLVPGNSNIDNPVKILKHPQDVHLFSSGCQSLIQTLQLDALLIDTQSGVSDTSLVTVTVSDTLIIILRLNQHDYQGTSVTMDVVRQLNIPRIVLMVNEAPTVFNVDDIKAKMEQTYDCEVVAILPHVDQIMALANKDIFALRYPQHRLTSILKDAAMNLIM